MTSSPNDYHHDLNRFAHTVWGNSQAVMKQHPEGFQYIDLGEYFNAFQYLFTAGTPLTHNKILVRSEYHIAFQALQTDAYQRGAYVLGHPGIGITLFLIYVLVLRLGQKQAVVLQFWDGNEFYALFKDTVTFHALDDADLELLYQCPSVWALCDSNEDIKIPYGIFNGQPDCIRVIQVTMPKASYWKEWSKQAGAKRYIMDIWSEEEVVYLAMLLELDIQHMITLAKKWGNLPRALLHYIGKEDEAVEAQYHREAGMAVRKCQLMMDKGTLCNFPDDPPSLVLFYFLRPMKTSTGGVNRELSYLYIPTRTLRRILAEALPGQNDLVRLQFYDALSEHPNTDQDADFIFATWFHSFLIVKRRIDCQWVVPGSGDDMVQFPTKSTPLDATDLVPQDAPKSAAPPYYWIPSKTHFLGISSILVLENGIFAFQVTIGTDWITSPIGGLECLEKMLPHHLKNLPWRVVFVGPEKVHVKYVATHWDGRLFFPTKKQRVPVGWSVVHPEQDDVPYMVYRDKSDPALTESEE